MWIMLALQQFSFQNTLIFFKILFQKLGNNKFANVSSENDPTAVSKYNISASTFT